MSIVDIAARDLLYRRIGEVMVAHGYVSVSPYWYKCADEVTTTLFIENYHSGFLFYISLGVYVGGITSSMPMKQPRLGKLHAYARLEQLTRVTTTDANNRVVLEIGKETENAKIVDEAVGTVATIGVGVADELLTIDGIRRVLERYGDSRWTIQPVLREKLFGRNDFPLPGVKV